VNTTGIWGQPVRSGTGAPATRLSGAGGANDIASSCGRFVIMASHEKKRFVDRVDYISSPGFLDGPGARQRHGLLGGGPSAIITTLGILRPDPETLEFELESYFEFSGVDEIRAATGWELRVRSDVHVVPAPTTAELQTLRRVDTTGMLRRK
jgi:glutaconate CoA-transferase subunit B